MKDAVFGPDAAVLERPARTLTDEEQSARKGLTRQHLLEMGYTGENGTMSADSLIERYGNVFDNADWDGWECAEAIEDALRSDAE